MMYGLDISAFQTDAIVPWSQVGQVCDFVICRATYGTKRDKRVVEHVQRVRDLGLTVGLYHFFRPVEMVEDQFTAFAETATVVGLKGGDLFPALDLEDDTAARPIGPVWNTWGQELADKLTEVYGDCLVYTTQRDWHRMGKPEWVLKRPLWVAHWTSAASPATPNGMPWRIWQYSVGPFDPDKRQRETGHARALDHDMAGEPLPLIVEQQEPIDPRTIQFFGTKSDDWYEAYVKSRDEIIKDADG